jgi:hypothetical protein
MPGELDKVPINPSHDFQLGVLFARVDATDKALLATQDAQRERDGFVDQQFSLVRNELKIIGSDMQKSVQGVMAQFQRALDAQTETLKPLIDKNLVAEGLEEQAKERSEANTNFWMRASAIVGILVILSGGIQYLIKVYVPADVTVTGGTGK